MTDALEFERTVARIGAAARAEDLFGPLEGAPAERLRAIAASYRRLVLVVHPDRHGPARAAAATRAIALATRLREEADRRIRAGTYGPRAVTSRARTYLVGDVVASGDVADLHACTWDDRGHQRRALLKVARSAADSDLLDREARVLSELYPPDRREERFYRYLPRLLDAFACESESEDEDEDEDGGARRRVNVLPRFDDHVSLEALLAAHPAGLDYRDVAWMLKRLFAALGFVHRRGFVHGAVVPPHVLVHPVSHGARLVDWCWAARAGERVLAMSKPWRALYAPEIPARRPAGPETDVFMATACAVALVGGDPAARRLPPSVPEPLARFLVTCLAPCPARRPDDAWRLHEDLDELLRRLVGTPRYRPLATPARA